MTKEFFGQLLEHPGLLDSNLIPELQSISSEYPYCSTTNILYLLGLYRNDDIRFDDHLKRTVIVANDRKKLKYLLHQATGALFKKRNSEVTGDSAIGIKSFDNSTDAYIVENEIKDLIPNLSVNIDATDYSVLLTTFHNTINKLGQIKNKINPRHFEAIKETVQHGFEEIMIKIESGELIVSGEQWTEPIPDDTIQKSKFIFEEIPHNDIISNILLQEHSAENKIADQRQSKDMELINKFILDEPRITPLKVDFFDPVNAAKNSITDHEEIVSETLALIYHKQGNTEKAVKIFKKLSLFYPEKSSYFAAQIQKLEQDLLTNT